MALGSSPKEYAITIIMMSLCNEYNYREYRILVISMAIWGIIL